MIQYISKFLYILGKNKNKLFGLLICILLLSLLETVGIGLIHPFMGLITSDNGLENNYWLAKAYQVTKSNSPMQFIGILGIFIITIFYIKSIVKYFLQRYIFRFGYNQQGQLRLRLLETYLYLPYSFHLKINSGLLIQNILNETHRFSNGILIATLNTAVHGFILCALIVLLLLTDPVATAIILVVLLVVFAIYQGSKKKLALWGKNLSQSETKMIQIVNHSLGSLKETKVIGCENHFINQLEKQAQRYSLAMSSALSFKILPLVIVESLIITFLIGFTSLYLLSGGDVQSLIPVMSVFAMASIRIIPSVNQIVAGVSGIRGVSYSFNKLYFDLKELEKIERVTKENSRLAKSRKHRSLSKKQLQSLPFHYQIALEQVSYRYPGAEEQSLNQINLRIKKGQSIALIGKSGAGKTTLVDVILGLLTPEDGDIQIDGKSIYGNLRSWQNLIGYIPQFIFLMDDTFESNIAFGVPEHQIDSGKLEQAIRAAQLTELVTQLPDGLKTQVGERGVRLSGGQRQRVGIARALYHEREILVLDEATAALDNETETLVTEAIRSLSGTKTMIIIAHRLSTVEHCDRIYELDKGRIVKAGNYNEVVLGNQNQV